MPRMNGSEPRIEIFKPFGEAFELMKKILFQPFDLRKWLVIGFAAWVANLGAGGGGIGNFNYPNNQREGAQKFNETISQIPQPVLITAICVLVCGVLLLIVLFTWLRARGRFILVDCIVRQSRCDRGAVERISWRRKQFLCLLTTRGARSRPGDRDCGPCAHSAVCPGPRSARTRCRVLDRDFADRIYLGLSYFRLGGRISADDPDHVSAALSRAACVFSSRGPRKLASRADPALRFVPSGVSSRGDCS